jgi:hypothetical protein
MQGEVGGGVCPSTLGCRLLSMCYGREPFPGADGRKPKPQYNPKKGKKFRPRMVCYHSFIRSGCQGKCGAENTRFLICVMTGTPALG